MERYSLRSADRADKKRDFHVVKFVKAMPSLHDKTSTVKVEKGLRRTDPPLTMTVSGERLEGARELVGVGAKSSSYMVFRVNEAGRVLSALPAASWYSFKPEIKYDTLTLDEVEAREKEGGRAREKLPGIDSSKSKLEKLREQVESKLEQEDEDGGGVGGMGDDDDGPGGGGGDGEDLFDGGGGGDDAFENEDGREGLDMEDEELFDDDDNDAFEDDDEQARDDRQQAQRSDGTTGPVGELDDEDADQRKGYDDSVKKQEKRITAYEKEQRGIKGDDESDDDDDDDDWEASDDLKAVLNAKEEQEPEEEKAKPNDRKRPAAASSDEPDANKRPKTELAAAKPKVSEKEVVEVIHASPKMSIKQLISKFKEFLKDAPSKAQFMGIVKVVARMEQEGDDKIVKLRESILDKYELR